MVETTKKTMSDTRDVLLRSQPQQETETHYVVSRENLQGIVEALLNVSVPMRQLLPVIDAIRSEQIFIPFRFNGDTFVPFIRQQ